MLRSKLSVLSAAVLFGLTGAYAKADLLAYEGITYGEATGTPLDGLTSTDSSDFGWASQWGSNGTGLLLSSAGLSYPGTGATVRGVAAKSDPASGSTVSYRVLSTPAVTAGTYYISALMDFTGQSGGNPFQDALMVNFGHPNNSPTINFGLGVDDGAPTGFVHAVATNDIFNLSTSNTTFADNVTHLVVAKVNLTADILSVFVDPPVGGGEPATPDVTAPITAPDGNFLNIRQFTGGKGIVDELKYGTAFADVVPGVTVVPPPSWVTTSGDWNNNLNWSSNTVPNAAGAEADLFDGGSLSTHTTGATVYTNIPITLGILQFNNPNTYVVTGAGSLTLQSNNSSPALVTVANGIQKLNLPLLLASNTTFNVSAGAVLKISDPLTISSGITLSTIGAGTVSYESTITLLSNSMMNIASSTQAHALSMAAGATTVISPSPANGPRTVLQLDSVSLASTSTLDLTNNKLVVNGGDLGTINASAATGYNNGAWNGNGISSSKAATDATHLHAVGVAQVGSTVVAAYTYYGDANLSGAVDGSDYSKIDFGYLSHLTGWQNGDFNYDGSVNGSDYTLIDNAFNRQGAALPSAQVAVSTAEIAGSGAAVPEPASLGVLAVGVIGIIGRRRRR